MEVCEWGKLPPSRGGFITRPLLRFPKSVEREEGRGRLTRLVVALTGIPGDDQLAPGAGDADVQQAQPFFDVGQLRPACRVAGQVASAFRHNLELADRFR